MMNFLYEIIVVGVVILMGIGQYLLIH